VEHPFGRLTLSLVYNKFELSQKDQITQLDKVSFVVSALFWFRSAVKFEKTSTIKALQKQILTNFETQLTNNSDRSLFRQLKQNMCKGEVSCRSLMHDYATVIRSIRNIDNPSRRQGACSGIQRALYGSGSDRVRIIGHQRSTSHVTTEVDVLGFC